MSTTVEPALPTFLPGSFRIESGTKSDYVALEHFHYLPKRPSSWAKILRIVHRDENKCDERVIAVAVLSFPTLASHPREEALRMKEMTFRERIAFANQHIRSISRVIVHPQFRSLGLASTLVREIIARCPTRYVEAHALMGRAHPFFKSAGMREITPDRVGAPMYYLFDRGTRDTGDPHID